MVYIATLTLIIGVITATVMNLFAVFNRARVKRDVMADGERIISSIASEIRRGRFIYAPTSVFNNASGQLSIDTLFDLPQDETITYVDFYIDNNRVYIKREGQDPLPINSEKTKVTELSFTNLTPEDSRFDSVKIKLAAEALNVPPRIQFPIIFDVSFSMRGDY